LNIHQILQETQAGRHVGISHEKAEKHASFFDYIETNHNKTSFFYQEII